MADFSTPITFSFFREQAREQRLQNRQLLGWEKKRVLGINSSNTSAQQHKISPIWSIILISARHPPRLGEGDECCNVDVLMDFHDIPDYA